MLKNTFINREATLKVAKALGELNEKVIYVGGAVVSLYVTDPAAEDVRPTKDIDITLEIASYKELEELRQQLIQKGFYQSHEDDVVCRFRFEDIKVDVMATKEIGWAPANRWFKAGFDKSIPVMLDDLEIKILPLTYFLASKFSAFNDRGNDARTSHDFEDIVYLLNYVVDIEKEVQIKDSDLRKYLMEEFEYILKDNIRQEAILGNLFYEDQEERYQRIIKLLENICNDL
jgi:predicted nucleotidyltransferase